MKIILDDYEISSKYSRWTTRVFLMTGFFDDGFFLRKAEFCAEVGAKGIQGIDLISFGGVR